MSTTTTSLHLPVLIAGFIIGANAAALNFVKSNISVKASTSQATPTERVTLGFASLSVVRSEASNMPSGSPLYANINKDRIVAIARHVGDYNRQVRDTCDSDRFIPLTLDMNKQNVNGATSSFIRACRGYF